MASLFSTAAAGSDDDAPSADGAQPFIVEPAAPEEEEVADVVDPIALSRQIVFVGHVYEEAEWEGRGAAQRRNDAAQVHIGLLREDLGLEDDPFFVGVLPRLRPERRNQPERAVFIWDAAFWLDDDALVAYTALAEQLSGRNDFPVEQWSDRIIARYSAPDLDFLTSRVVNWVEAKNAAAEA